MKKIIKNPIFTFIIGAIIFGSIGSVVAYNYNASQVSYSPKDTSWNVSTVEGAISDLKNNKKIGLDLIWTNPNPNSSFAQQTINLDLSNYKYILITVNATVSDIYFPRGYSLIPIGDNYEFPNHVGVTGGSCYRNIRADNSGVVISNEAKCPNNTYSIPYKIYGIKENLDIELERED